MSVLTGIGPGLILWNILLAFAGNAVGVWRALRGQRSVTWSAPASARRRGLVTPPARSGDHKEKA